MGKLLRMGGGSISPKQSEISMTLRRANEALLRNRERMSKLYADQTYLELLAGELEEELRETAG